MKKAITYSLFLWVICLYSQEKTTLGLTLNHLAISVKDVNKAADFYSKILYLPEITNRTQKEGIRWFSLGDGKELHLISTITSPVIINKAVHLALTTPHFDALIKQLQKEHIPFSDWPGEPNKITTRADGIQQVYFQDPDGYWIEVNSFASK